MFALIRLLIVGFIVLTIVYVCLSLYSRAVRRGKLEAAWDEEHGPDDGEENPERDAFIDQGLRDYDGSLRRKLILMVYILPTSAMIGIIYVINYM